VIRTLEGVDSAMFNPTENESSQREKSFHLVQVDKALGIRPRSPTLRLAARSTWLRAFARQLLAECGRDSGGNSSHRWRLLFAGQRDFDCFARQLRTRPRWSFREIGAKANGNVALCGGGGAPTTIVCGSLSFDRASLKPITQLLPTFVLMKADQARTLALHTTVQALASEMEERAPGSEVVASRLAENYPGTPGAYRVGTETQYKDGFVRFSILKWALR
jgi:hypothetical protein